jgi:hypothetical protein
MASFDAFRNEVDALIHAVEREASVEDGLSGTRQCEERQRLILAGDEHAIRALREIVYPRMEYLALLFSHAAVSQSAGDDWDRHECRLWFRRTDDFRCTADAVARIAHDPEPAHYSATFTFSILPAHVTDVCQSFEACRLEFLQDDHLAAFIDRGITHFITHYLRAREKFIRI